MEKWNAVPVRMRRDGGVEKRRQWRQGGKGCENTLAAGVLQQKQARMAPSGSEKDYTSPI